ncbi:hypothetical protein ACFWVU_31050 [Streptomyces sp. NPDC058686]|uniref:hypothetical protein n=1 Tax=Streptomyces sp. NPDC058686 TaxID=3346599 RepID=UPI00365E1729
MSGARFMRGRSVMRSLTAYGTSRRTIPLRERMRMRMRHEITDIDHTVATHRTLEDPHQELPTARQTNAAGLTAPTHSEIHYRVLMKPKTKPATGLGCTQ